MPRIFKVRGKPSQPAHRPTAGNETERKASGPQSVKTVGSGKSAGGLGWYWIFAIIAFIFVIWLANNGGQNTKKTSYKPSPPTSRPYDNGSNRSSLVREIENGKTRVKQIETQIKDMDDRPHAYKLKMNSYRASGLMDGYNMVLPHFTLLVSKRNDLNEKRSRLIDEVNSKVVLYNSVVAKR